MTQGSNLSLMYPSLAVGFFTTDSSKAGKSWLLHFLCLPTSNALVFGGISEDSFQAVISAACIDTTVTDPENPAEGVLSVETHLTDFLRRTDVMGGAANLLVSQMKNRSREENSPIHFFLMWKEFHYKNWLLI